MNGRSGRKDQMSSTGAGSGDSAEAARYLAATAADMARIAKHHGFETLGYLLDMAHMEADEIGREPKLTVPR